MKYNIEGVNKYSHYENKLWNTRVWYGVPAIGIAVRALRKSIHPARYSTATRENQPTANTKLETGYSTFC